MFMSATPARFSVDIQHMSRDEAKMADRQERSDGRIGNTAELRDEPVGHFRLIPKGRAGFDRPVRHRSRPYAAVRPSIGSCRIGQIRQRRGHAMNVHTA